jgi:hypothetical protein
LIVNSRNTRVVSLESKVNSQTLVSG